MQACFRIRKKMWLRVTSFVKNPADFPCTRDGSMVGGGGSWIGQCDMDMLILLKAVVEVVHERELVGERRNMPQVNCSDHGHNDAPFRGSHKVLL